MEYRRKRTLRDLLYVSLKNKSVILLLFLAALCISLIYCIATPTTYRAETRLVTRVEEPRVVGLDRYRPDSYVALARDGGPPHLNPTGIITGEYLTRKVLARLQGKIVPLKTGPAPIGQIAETVRTGSRAVLAPVGLSTSPSEPAERMVLTFLDRIHVGSFPDTTMISIAFDWTDPRFAALVANTYADEYVMQQTVVDDSQRLRTFYADQADLLQKRLKEAEDRYQAFLSGADFADLGLQKELLLRSAVDINNRMAVTDTEIGQISARIKRVGEMARRRDRWIETPELYASDRQGYLRSLDETYAGLWSEKERLLKNRAPDDPEIKVIDGRMESLKIQKMDEVLDMAGTELSLAQKRKSILARQLSAERQRLKSITSKSVALEQLLREKELVEQDYRAYRRAAEDLRVTNDLEARKISGIKVIVPAIPPLVPAYPKRGVLILYSALGGLLLGLLVSAVKEFFDHTFRDEYQVAEILDVPLLLSVPQQTHYGPPASAARGAINGAVTRLRRILGQELRRPLWGNGSARSGTTLTLIAILAAACLLYLFRSLPFILPQRFPATRAFTPVPGQERLVSLSAIYPSVWSDRVDSRPSVAPEPGLSERTLLSDEMEKQRGDLEKRRQDAEVELRRVRPEGY
jgi:uncharacterized protein involved in exopolysaccharide biosynthesis